MSVYSRAETLFESVNGPARMVIVKHDNVILDGNEVAGRSAEYLVQIFPSSSGPFAEPTSLFSIRDEDIPDLINALNSSIPEVKATGEPTESKGFSLNPGDVLKGDTPPPDGAQFIDSDNDLWIMKEGGVVALSVTGMNSGDLFYPHDPQAGFEILNEEYGPLILSSEVD